MDKVYYEYISLEDELPDYKEMVILVAKDVEICSGSLYTTDPYCGWRDYNKGYARWPHVIPPTHFMRFKRIGN